MSEIEKKWYVMRAVSGKEAKVKEYIEADMKNGSLGDYVSQVLVTYWWKQHWLVRLLTILGIPQMYLVF